MDYKLVIAVRSDLDLSRGKLAVQVAHAAVMAALEAKARHRKWFAEWIAEGPKKVVVKGGPLPELRSLQAKARTMHLPTALVENAALRYLPPGTVTCVGIGPVPNSIVDQVTARLPVMALIQAKSRS